MTKEASDPLAEAAGGILAHMNADHADALVLYCRAFADVEADEATMIGIDHDGFTVEVRRGGDVMEVRIAFPGEVRNAVEARKTLVAMLHEARARTGDASA
jgi:putative heme iron utilization protein